MMQMSGKSSTLSYRAEIDGLRAVAVISVILYHARMVLFGRDWFEGGYIGVDIFFVVSGYLITRIILSELKEKDSFSFQNFYERRARRILPMLFLVIFVSIPFAWQKLLPTDFVDYAESIFSSIFFGSNFYFYFSTTEYGADSALLKPFLHTWSLGVEEQFYIVFPFVALVLYKFFRPHFLAILVVLSLLSLQFAEVMEVRNADLNFYHPFSRFWELAVGSFFAVRELSHKDERDDFWSKLLPILGLFLIAYSILFFDSNTPHPSLYTIIPILGVALIIGFASRENLVGKVLGSKPLVWVGLISYSAYLWHFPIFAFSRNGSSEPSNYDKFEWIVVTIILSLASYLLVEQPFRNRKLISARMLWLALGVATVSIASFMAYAVYSEGLWGRYTTVQQGVIEGFNKREYRALDHPLLAEGVQLLSNKPSINCSMRDPSEACRFGREKLVFLGDSMVGHYERAVIDALHGLELGFISFNYDQCPFVSDVIWFGNVAECTYVNEQRKKVIEAFEDNKIFVISANEDQFDKPKKRTDDPIGDGRKNRTEGESVEGAIAWESYFSNIRWLESMGHKVILIRTIPATNLDAIKWLGDNTQYLRNTNFPNVYNESKPSVIREMDANRYPNFDTQNVLVLDPVDVLCDSRLDRCFDVMKGLGPLYNGGRHQSYVGASLMAEKVKEGILRLGWEKL
jgi:peptidoglycan/LPS O-acetylase OafA/YrhL